MEDEFALLERATAGIEIVPCERCTPEGHIKGLPVAVLCPVCRGTKLTTRSTDDES